MSSVVTTERGLRVETDAGCYELTAVTPSIVRVRRGVGETPLERYGFLETELPVPAFEITTDDRPTLSTAALSVSLDPSGCVTTSDADGQELLRELEPGRSGSKLQATFRLPPDLRFFGLGDQSRDRLEHRGTIADLLVLNVKSYVPIPLLLTTGGFGILVNTTRRLLFDLGATHEDRYGFEAAEGELDYYLIAGPSLKQILANYCELTGLPPLPPKWAFGLFFICRTQADAHELMEDCWHFRNADIPCDAISLEPGWMAKNYDYAVTKDWHPERFPVPSYCRHGRHNFLNAAIRMGFKPGLWLCNDYDLSWEEERRVAASRPQAAADEGESSAGHEQDEHVLRPRYMDQLTRRDEPWFRHLEDFVEQGVRYFKQDGANQVLLHPDRLYGNGMTDDEMHNLNPLLYAKQMYLGFLEQTGQRPFVFTVSGWTGMQRYANTWTGDTGGEHGPLAACLNLSMTGHGMTTPDMEVTSKEGIHFGFLLGWAQLNSWNYWRHPWLLGEPLTDIFRDYAKLRYMLIPYLYSCAWSAHTTGLPLLRAMPLEFTEDPETHNLLNQYLLGPSLLVGAFTDRVYLPAGTWYDAWRGQRFDGPGWVEPDVPADRGGPIFARAGSLLPMGEAMDYVGQRPETDLTVHVWPGPASTFTLYEDDGLSMGYLEGHGRATLLRQERFGSGLKVTVAASAGTFPDALTARALGLVAHLETQPNEIWVNGEETTGEWHPELLTLAVDLEQRAVDEAVEIVIR